MRKRALVPVVALTASAVAVLVLVLSGGSASGQPGPASGDHYFCYEAVDETTPQPQDPPPVTLRDQFEQGTFDPGRADRLCTPAGKLHEGAFFQATDPVTHLKRYPIKRDTVFQRRTVLVQNQFGHYVLRVLDSAWLLVPTTKSRNLEQPPPPPNPEAPGYEHYKCYLTSQTPRVDDQFGSRRVVVFAAVLCNPVQKNEEQIRNRDRHLLCYRVAATPFQANVLVGNQFGLERLRLISQRDFCVPSKKTVVTPPPPPN